MCFSRSAPPTLIEGLLWAPGATLPGRLQALSSCVMQAHAFSYLKVELTIQSSVLHQAEAGSSPEVVSCCLFPPLSYSPDALTSFSCGHFLYNVLHMTGIAHESSSQGLLLGHVCVRRRWYCVWMGVGKSISSYLLGSLWQVSESLPASVCSSVKREECDHLETL